MKNQVQLTELQKKQIETYLKEYEVLRSEIPNKEQRIQTVLSLYIAALLGVSAFIMKEGFDEMLSKSGCKWIQEPKLTKIVRVTVITELA